MFRQILRNSDLLIGLVLAALVAALSALGVAKQQLIESAILALLALILSVFFRLRMTISKINAEADQRSVLLENLAQQLAGRRSVSADFLLEYPDLSHLIESAQEILIVAGGTFRTTIGSYRNQFRTALQRGAKVHACCPDPDSPALIEQLAASQRISIESTRSAIQGNLEIALKLCDLPSSRGGGIEVRTLPHLPTTGFIYFRIGEPSSQQLWVKILPYSFDSGAAPVFFLDPLLDPLIFPSLLEAATTTWADGKTVGVTVQQT